MLLKSVGLLEELIQKEKGWERVLSMGEAKICGGKERVRKGTRCLRVYGKVKT